MVHAVAASFRTCAQAVMPCEGAAGISKLSLFFDRPLSFAAVCNLSMGPHQTSQGCNESQHRGSIAATGDDAGVSFLAFH